MRPRDYSLVGLVFSSDTLSVMSMKIRRPFRRTQAQFVQGETLFTQLVFFKRERLDSQSFRKTAYFMADVQKQLLVGEMDEGKLSNRPEFCPFFQKLFSLFSEITVGGLSERTIIRPRKCKGRTMFLEAP